MVLIISEAVSTSEKFNGKNKKLRLFLTVFWEFEPQTVVGHRVDPQKALPYVTTRVLNHRA